MNILFETTHLRSNLRPWVKKALFRSQRLVKKWSEMIDRRKSLNEQLVSENVGSEQNLDSNNIDLDSIDKDEE